MSMYHFLFFVCMFWSSFWIETVASSTILTSDVGGSNNSIVICPNELVTLTCSTSSGVLVWLYPGNSFIYESSSTIDNPTELSVQGSSLEFRLTGRNDSNYVSTVVVNSTFGLNISCSPNGSPSNASITILVQDAPPPPADVTLTNVQFDRISLEWSAILSADFYRITVSPTPSSGDCSSGTCTFSSLNATIGHLPLAMIMIGVSSVNCAGQGNSTVRVENTIPEAIAETNIDDDDDDGNNDTFTVCPNDSVNITCQTKSALIWLLSGNILIAYDAISPIGTTEEKEGFAITLLESDGTSFMSVVDTRMNSSFNLSCSPSGVVGDVNNAEIAVTVLDVLSRPSDLVTKEVCLSQVELEWTHDTSADDYIITIAPPPATGLCANGTCSSDVDIVCDDDKCTFIVDSLEAIQYTYSVSSVNCAGIGQPSSTTEAVVAEEPGQPTITLLYTTDEGSDRDNTVGVFLQWVPPSTTCTTPTIDSYTATITSNAGDTSTNVICCNNTFLLERCGLYSFIVEANNRVGSGPPSLPKAITSGTPSQSIALSKVTDDSVFITAKVGPCLIPAVVNISVKLSQRTAEVTRSLFFSYPSDSFSANLTITDLVHDTEYNVTVTIFYEESGNLKSLSPEELLFATSENFFTLQNIVIGSLTAGTFIGIVIFALILIIGSCCLREVYYRKKIKKLQRRQTKILATQVEIQQDLEDIQENKNTISTPDNYTNQYNLHQQHHKKPQNLYPALAELEDSTYM